LFLPLERQRTGPSAPPRAVNSPARLYNVVDDPAEARDVAATQPEIVARLTGLASTARLAVGDLDLPGRAERPAGWVFNPQLQRLPTK
jgi:hypothetical protein